MKTEISDYDSVLTIVCRNDDDTILSLFDVDMYMMPCSALNFYVNGIEADEDDFCDYDITGDIKKCTCCYKKIPLTNPSQELLDKYEITSEQYKYIANLIKEHCEVNGCGKCL